MLLLLQLLLFLLTILMLLQDLVPLGRWNALSTLNAGRSLATRVRATVINTATVALAFACTLSGHWSNPSSWQHKTTLIILFAFLLGAFFSWWKPWLFGASGARIQELRPIWQHTYTFLPERHGVVPNALHCLFHLLALLALALTLAMPSPSNLGAAPSGNRSAVPERAH